MTVDLPEAEWVKVLNLLANYSFKNVAGLMQQIQMQLQQQAQAQQEMDQRPNGRDAAPGEMRVS